MRPARLPRLRCALLGLLPLWARDGGMRMTGGERGGAGESAVPADGWKRVVGAVVTKKS